MPQHARVGSCRLCAVGMAVLITWRMSLGGRHAPAGQSAPESRIGQQLTVAEPSRPLAGIPAHDPPSDLADLVHATESSLCPLAQFSPMGGDEEQWCAGSSRQALSLADARQFCVVLVGLIEVDTTLHAVPLIVWCFGVTLRTTHCRQPPRERVRKYLAIFNARQCGQTAHGGVHWAGFRRRSCTPAPVSGVGNRQGHHGRCGAASVALYPEFTAHSRNQATRDVQPQTPAG